MRTALLALPLLLVATADAAPREGANHRLGDDSFVETFGRSPQASDDEALRMRVHLAYVRAKLGAAAATRPELASRRAEILGYLDEYIAKGITPANAAVPLRTPVFIDDFGNICAVGYLIERTTGSRAVPERIAKSHRFDYLEDIAAALPEVRAWVDGSGFTLEELASIQPGYQEPDVESWVRWAPKDWKNGRLDRKVPFTGIAMRGSVVRGRMTGAWTNEVNGKVIGKGTFVRGNGAWTSFYQSGAKLAQGRFVANDPSGRWRFFHESGNLAAEGNFKAGYRDGLWRFYDDTPARSPIAKGAFANGSIVGAWKHYDSKGKLLAVSRETPSDDFGEYLLEVVPGPDKIRHEHHSVGGPDQIQLHAAYLGNEALFTQYRYGETYRFDASGFRLERVDGTWRAADCQWSAKRKRIAKHGDTTTLHRLLRSDELELDEVPCGEATLAVAAPRTEKLDMLLAAETGVRSPSPTFVKELALGRYSGAYNDSIRADDSDADGVDDSDASALDPAEIARLAKERADEEAAVADLPRLLAASMAWYIEFPHVDGRFVRVFHTLPGYGRRDVEVDED